MSRGIPHAIVRNTWVGVAVATLLPVVVHAAASNTSPAPNETTIAAKADAARQPAKPPTPSSAIPEKTNTAPKTAPSPAKPVLRAGVRTPASFTQEMPLSEAIDILKNCTNPPLPIVVLWRDLDGAGIYRETAIGIDGIPGLRLSQYLDLLVLSLSAGATADIGYTVHHGVITIASTSALPATKPITRVYDITDLVSPPSSPFPPMGFGGMYGGQMMGPAGSYGGGLGMGYGMGSSYTPGTAYGRNRAGGLPGIVGGTPRTSPGPYRTR